MITTVSTIALVLPSFLLSVPHIFPPAGTAHSAQDSGDYSSLPVPVNGGLAASTLQSSTVSMTDTMHKAYADQPQHAAWLESTVVRIWNYSSASDGWKGEGTVAPSSETIEEAVELTSQFAREMPNLVSPMISADDDGSICFYWRDGGMMATVSVYSDGSYAFYAEGYDDPIRSDSELVGEPLPPSLIATMTGSVVRGLIAA